MVKSRADQRAGRFDVQFAIPSSWRPGANTVLVAATTDNRLVATAPFVVVAGPPPEPPICRAGRSDADERAGRDPNDGGTRSDEPGQLQVQLSIDAQRFRAPGQVRFVRLERRVRRIFRTCLWTCVARYKDRVGQPNQSGCGQGHPSDL